MLILSFQEEAPKDSRLMPDAWLPTTAFESEHPFYFSRLIGDSKIAPMPFTAAFLIFRKWLCRKTWLKADECLRRRRTLHSLSVIAAKTSWSWHHAEMVGQTWFCTACRDEARLTPHFRSASDNVILLGRWWLCTIRNINIALGHHLESLEKHQEIPPWVAKNSNFFKPFWKAKPRRSIQKSFSRESKCIAQLRLSCLSSAVLPTLRLSKGSSCNHATLDLPVN